MMAITQSTEPPTGEDRMPMRATHSGIPIIGDLAWGSHFCHFYATAADLADCLVPYFKAGIDTNEACFWITAEPFGVADATAALRAAVPDLARRLKRGQVEIVDVRDYHERNGRLDPDAVLGSLPERKDRALARDCAGLRASGNTCCIDTRDEWRNLAEYEAKVNACLRDHRILGLCSYHLDRCSAVDAIEVVRHHQFTLVRRSGEWEMIESASLKRTKAELHRANPELERRVAERTAQLHESERHFREVLAALPAAVYTTDAAGRLTSNNMPEQYAKEWSVEERKRDGQGELIEQQTALARFGELALKSDDLTEILNEACRLVGSTLRTNLAKILELQKGGKTLLVRAGFGWGDDVVGKATIAVGPTSSAGHAMSTGEPVVSSDIENDDRFDYPEFLKRNSVRAAVNTIIIGPEGQPPYGVLEVDSRTPVRFTEDDIHFLRTYANLISSAVVRLRIMCELRREAEDKARLLRELQHRVSNNLQAITSLIRLQQRQAKGREAAQQLKAVGQRIEALYLVHDKFYVSGEVERLCLGTYLAELGASLLRFRAPEAGKVRLVSDCRQLCVSARLAVPLGMIVNEFIVNSLQYAFDDGNGTIGIRLEESAPRVARLTLWDDGKGLPQERRSGVGMQLISGFARQIGAAMEWESKGGTLLILTIPCESE
jgi:two-component sensor histidine kinase